ncbi:MAG: YigZ family protein [Bacilli bacterium]|nr:YigZ family protein [Bacilli bacterium]
MYTIKENISNETEINKSKFITFLYKINNVEDIKTYLNQVKNNYKDATHHCYAYILDANEKMSDDKEPSGTAGSPILNVLKQNKLNRILCIVVRYFGGIKLGAGGLVRAYSNVVKEALKKAEIKELVKGKKVRIEIDYNDIDKLNYILKDNKVIYKEYNDKVIYEVLLKNEDIKNIEIFSYQILEDIFIAK